MRHFPLLSRAYYARLSRLESAGALEYEAIGWFGCHAKVRSCFDGKKIKLSARPSQPTAGEVQSPSFCLNNSRAHQSVWREEATKSSEGGREMKKLIPIADARPTNLKAISPAEMLLVPGRRKSTDCIFIIFKNSCKNIFHYLGLPMAKFQFNSRKQQVKKMLTLPLLR
jgi:hypothetical protein